MRKIELERLLINAVAEAVGQPLPYKKPRQRAEARPTRRVPAHAHRTEREPAHA